MSAAHRAPGQGNQKAQDVGLLLFYNMLCYWKSLLIYIFNRSYHTAAYHVTWYYTTQQLLFHTYHTTQQHITLYRKYYTMPYHATTHHTIPYILYHTIPHTTLCHNGVLPHHINHSIASMPYHSTAQHSAPHRTLLYHTHHIPARHITPHHTTEEPAWPLFRRQEPLFRVVKRKFLLL